MRTFIRTLSVLIFSTLFVLLVSSLFAQANTDGIIVEPVDKHYPVEMIRFHTRIRLDPGRPIPWWVKKSGEKYRIFNAGAMHAQIRSWDHLDKDLFLRRLDDKGASGVASLYAQFTAEQLEKAEVELRRVKEEK